MDRQMNIHKNFPCILQDIVPFETAAQKEERDKWMEGWSTHRLLLFYGTSIVPFGAAAKKQERDKKVRMKATNALWHRALLHNHNVEVVSVHFLMSRPSSHYRFTILSKA